MELMMRFAITLVVSIALVGPALGATASAAPYPFRINGGVANRHFWISPAMINPIYGQIARESVASWNNTGGSAVFYTETGSQCCDSQADWYATAYGATPWYGITEFFASGGQWLQVSEGSPPFANWDYAQIGLNDTYLSDTVLFNTYNKVKAVAAHEFGHAIGLDHEDPDNLCQLMDADVVDNWTGCNQLTYQPRSWDRHWALML